MAAARDGRIDFLRALGLLLIMLAHVDPPEWLFELRGFDVVLMVLLNALSFRASGGARGSWGGYVARRFRRLIVPTWCFLIPVLLWLTVMGIWFPGARLSLTDYLSSFSLTAGIGYVWIIRVYFQMALISPLLLAALRRWGLRRYLAVLALAAPVYELYCIIAPAGENLPGYLSHYVVQDTVGYGLVCALGIALPEMARRQRLGAAAYAGAGFLLLGAARGFPPVQDAKYPPGCYYLAYGVLVSLLLWELLSLPQARPLREGRLWGWLSRNSFWLYFWHIVPVLVFQDEMASLEPFWARYLVVLAAAAVLTGLHNQIRRRLRPARA